MLGKPKCSLLCRLLNNYIINKVTFFFFKQACFTNNGWEHYFRKNPIASQQQYFQLHSLFWFWPYYCHLAIKQSVFKNLFQFSPCLHMYNSQSAVGCNLCKFKVSLDAKMKMLPVNRINLCHLGHYFINLFYFEKKKRNILEHCLQSYKSMLSCTT